MGAGDTLTQGDLDDIRRSSGLKKEDGVRANDFLLAMLIRLGAQLTSPAPRSILFSPVALLLFVLLLFVILLWYYGCQGEYMCG